MWYLSHIFFWETRFLNLVYYHILQFSQFISVAHHVWLFAIPWIAACQASLSVTNSQPELTQTHVHWLSDAIQSSHPLLSPSLPAFSIRVFFKGSVLLIRWPKYWSFSFSITHSNEYSGLIYFRNDWLDLLAVQRTLESLLQYHSSKASVLWCSAFFTR